MGRCIRPAQCPHLRQLLLGDRTLVFSVESPDRGVWHFGHHGDRWEIEVVDERTRHIRSLTGEGQKRSGGGILRAPMPGLVVRVLVEPGQRVTAGAGVVVLEAMKMENQLKAPAEAVVKSVMVSPGRRSRRGSAGGVRGLASGQFEFGHQRLSRLG
jgi:pyruvate carboxylase subunit B